MAVRDQTERKGGLHICERSRRLCEVRDASVSLPIAGKGTAVSKFSMMDEFVPFDRLADSILTVEGPAGRD
jgi:hypothetical protein